MAKIHARFQSSPRHEETKNTDKIRKRVNRTSHSKVIKEPINSGSYYKCVVCNNCLYSRSVGTFKRDNLSAFFDKVVSGVLSFDGNFHICMTCAKKLKKMLFLVKQFIIN